MNKARAFCCQPSLSLAVLLTYYTSNATAQLANPISECISAEAKKNLDDCPANSPRLITAKNRAFLRVRHSGEVTKQVDTAKPGDSGTRGSKTIRDQRERPLRARARTLLITEMQQIERLLTLVVKNSPDRLQLLRRLAEGYIELETAAARDEVAERNAAADANKGSSSFNVHKTAAAQSKTIAEAAHARAIKYYSIIKDKYPDYAMLDEVIYYLAYEFEQGQDFANARAAYFELIKRCPHSSYIPYTHLALGELYFQEAQGEPSKFDQAAAAYKEVIKYPLPDNRVYIYARYKLGHVHWNKGEYAEALNEFRAVIDYGDRYSDVPNAMQLAKNTRRDLIPLYAMIGSPTKAYKFFKPLSGDTAGSDSGTIDLLNALAAYYLDTGRFMDGISLYQELVKRDNGERACHYQSQITTATSALKASDKSAIRRELDKQLEIRNAFLKDNHTETSKLECSNRSAELFAETAMSWHLETVGSGGVRGTGDRTTIALVDYLYRKVIENFSSEDFAKFEFPRIVKEDWPTIYKVKYAIADLLYFQQRWEECGAAFSAVFEEDPTGAEAGWVAFAAALCYQKTYDQIYAGNSDRKGTDLLAESQKVVSDWEKFKPKVLTPRQKGTIQALNAYVCLFRQKEGDLEGLEQYVNFKYARARTYFEAQHWEEAALGFRDVALNYANSGVGVYAMQLYLESMNILGSRSELKRPICYADLAKDVPELLQLYCDNEKLDPNKDQCELLARSQFDIMHVDAKKAIELADTQQIQGKASEAIDSYRRGAEKYLELWMQHCKGPFSEKRDSKSCERPDEIVYDMARAYQNCHLLAKAVYARQILVDPRYGLHKSSLAHKAMYELGGNYETLAIYDAAAEWYERYAKETTCKGEYADLALSNAVILRLGLGDDDKAVFDARNFNRCFDVRRPALAAQISFAVAAYYGEKKDWQSVVQLLGRAIASIDKHATLDVRIQAHALLGRSFLNTKQRRSAATEYGKVVGVWKNPDKAVDEIKSIKDEPEEATNRRLERAIEAVGEALFFFAEEKRRALDTIKFPAHEVKSSNEGLHLAIELKVKDWVGKMQPLIEAATAEYRKITELRPAPPIRWVIAGSLQVGSMWGRLVKEIRAAPITDSVKYDKELRAAYNKALVDASATQMQAARGAFDDCLSYSTKFQHFDENSRRCEIWLVENFKAEYHLLEEFRGSPNRVNSPFRERSRPVRIGGAEYVPDLTVPHDSIKKVKSDWSEGRVMDTNPAKSSDHK